MATPAADYDGAWKYALEQFFPAFLSLFFPDAHQAIDWAQPVVFRDTELEQIAPEDQAGKQRIDKLVELRRPDGEPALVLVHIEVQSQRDSDFAPRMFRYHARLFDRMKLPMVSLAVLGDEELNWRPNSFGYEQWGCKLRLEFPTVKLRALDKAVLEAAANPIATLVLLHRDAQETRGKQQDRLRRKVMRFRAMLRQGYSVEDIRRLLRVMEHLLRLRPDLELIARNEMRRVEQEEYGMERFVTSFERIGREEGRVEGRVEGREQERRELVLRLLERKIGPVNAKAQERVDALGSDQLLLLGDALLDFSTAGDLDAWLTANNTQNSEGAESSEA
jgi:hypothetical protein